MDCLSYYFDMDNNASCNSFYELIKYSINNRKLKEVINKILQYIAYNTQLTKNVVYVCVTRMASIKRQRAELGEIFFVISKSTIYTKNYKI